MLSLTPVHSSPTERALPSASLPRRAKPSASWDYKTQQAGSRAHYQGPQLCQWGTAAPLQVSWEEKEKPRVEVWAPRESLTICIMPSNPWTWWDSRSFQTHLRAATEVLRGLKERKWCNTVNFQKKIFLSLLKVKRGLFEGDCRVCPWTLQRMDSCMLNALPSSQENLLMSHPHPSEILSSLLLSALFFLPLCKSSLIG